MEQGHLFQFSLLLGVLGIAATLSLLLRLPIVPLYILAGLGLGQFLVPDEVVGFLGSLGVVFLLFSMGLEFSAEGLRKTPGAFLRTGLVDWVFNFPIGLIVGIAFGWSLTSSLFLAGIVYMSSSAVVSKCIVDFGRAARPETETILRIMVFEDFVIAIYLVAMNALLASQGSDPMASSPLFDLLRSVLFVAALVVLAWRFQGVIARLFASRSEEGFTLVLFAFVLLVASSAMAAGLSEAIGAFLAGLVVGGTQLKERAARALGPHQMLFAALFFVSFGMQMDLTSVPDVAGVAVLLILLGLASKIVGGFVAGRSAGHTTGQSLVVGLSLAPKGEFSIVLAGLASATAAADSHIEALTGLYVLGLSVLGPIGMRQADTLQRWLMPVRREKPKETPAPTPRA